jgi:hypothetical protein
MRTVDECIADIGYAGSAAVFSIMKCINVTFFERTFQSVANLK